MNVSLCSVFIWIFILPFSCVAAGRNSRNVVSSLFPSQLPLSTWRAVSERTGVPSSSSSALHHSNSRDIELIPLIPSINVGNTPAGRIKFELFSDIVPKSVAPLPCIV